MTHYMYCVLILARQGGRILFMLNGEERSDIVRSLADNLISRADFILEANRADLSLAKRTKLAGPLSSRLALTPAKLKSLSDGKIIVFFFFFFFFSLLANSIKSVSLSEVWVTTGRLKRSVYIFSFFYR